MHEDPVFIAMVIAACVMWTTLVGLGLLFSFLGNRSASTRIQFVIMFIFMIAATILTITRI